MAIIDVELVILMMFRVCAEHLTHLQSEHRLTSGCLISSFYLFLEVAHPSVLHHVRFAVSLEPPHLPYQRGGVIKSAAHASWAAGCTLTRPCTRSDLITGNYKDYTRGGERETAIGR